MSHKRTEHPDEKDDDFEEEQQVASPEVLAQRKIFKAKRTFTSGEEGKAPATTGAFKGFSNIAPQAGGAPAGFGFGFGSFGKPATTTTTAAPEAPEENERVKTRMEPGNAATASAPAPANPPAFGFGFGKAPATDGAAKAPAFGFGFGKAPATTDASKAAPSTFGFGFGGAAPAAPTVVEGEKKGEEPKAAAPAVGFTFGQASSFQSTVTSFVQARQKIDESKESNAEGEKEGEGEDEKEEADAEANLAPTVVESTPGELLASAPAKLYHLKKKEGGGNEWVECGQGESKLKKQKKKDEESCTDFSYRLLVRDGYALNVLVSSKTFVLQTTKPKNFAFSVPTAEDKVETYNIKFTGANGEAHCEKMLKEIKAILEADK